MRGDSCGVEAQIRPNPIGNCYNSSSKDLIGISIPIHDNNKDLKIALLCHLLTSNNLSFVSVMNVYKLAATLIEDGTLVLKGLPFHAGDTVEVIVLEQPKEPSASQPTEYPLQGKQPYRYDDPFEPAVPVEDWEVLK